MFASRVHSHTMMQFPQLADFVLDLLLRSVDESLRIVAADGFGALLSQV